MLLLLPLAAFSPSPRVCVVVDASVLHDADDRLQRNFAVACVGLEHLAQVMVHRGHAVRCQLEVFLSIDGAADYCI